MKIEKYNNLQALGIGLLFCFFVFGATTYIKNELPKEHRIDITN